MYPPVSPVVATRLMECFSLAHPNDDPSRIAKRAYALITSLRSAGLDVVCSTWVNDPLPLPEVAWTRPRPVAVSKRTVNWDSMVDKMREIMDTESGRAPWKP